VANPVLIIIDVQCAIDDPSWGDDRNNPDAEEKMAALLAHWRERRWPVFHVRHASTDPKSTYRRGQPLFEFKKEVAPINGEEIIEKSTNSAFIGTNLEEMLRSQNIVQVVITGVITNNSVEATARMSGNLGFQTFVASDATATFGRHDFAGRWRTADEVHAMSLANLDGEYATVLSKDAILRFATELGDTRIA
jgi:nicotinamidase-related amidase